MSHQEYPKALYLQGNLKVVEDEAQEADAVEAGYADWHTDQELLQTGAAATDAPAGQAVPSTTGKKKKVA